MGQNEVFVATLEKFLQAVSQKAGIHLKELGANRTLVIETDKGTYSVTVLDPENGRVRVRGTGEAGHFAEPTECVLNGSTFGGSMLKMRWIGIGMFLGFSHAEKHITTAMVTSIGLAQPEQAKSYFH